MILGENQTGHEIAEHIAKKVKVNPQILSTLKNEISIRSMNPGGEFETSMVRPPVILVALVKSKIRQGSSKSAIFLGDLPRVLFLHSFSLAI